MSNPLEILLAGKTDSELLETIAKCLTDQNNSFTIFDTLETMVSDKTPIATNLFIVKSIVQHVINRPKQG